MSLSILLKEIVIRSQLLGPFDSVSVGFLLINTGFRDRLACSQLIDHHLRTIKMQLQIDPSLLSAVSSTQHHRPQFRHPVCVGNIVCVISKISGHTGVINLAINTLLMFSTNCEDHLSLCSNITLFLGQRHDHDML